MRNSSINRNAIRQAENTSCFQAVFTCPHAYTSLVEEVIFLSL